MATQQTRWDGKGNYARLRVEHVWNTPCSPYCWPPSGRIDVHIQVPDTWKHQFIFISPGCLAGILLLGVFSVFVASSTANSNFNTEAAPHPLNTYTYTRIPKPLLPRIGALLSHSIQLIQLGLYRFFMCISPRHCHTYPSCPFPVASCQFSQVHFLLHVVVVAAPECLIYLWLEEDSLAAASFCSLLKKENALRAWESTEPFAKI